jgi:FkbM family methyltransferase
MVDEAAFMATVAHIPSLDIRFEFLVHRRTDLYISGDLLRDKIWEPFETTVLGRLCAPGDVVVDLGANIGWYSVVASRIIGPAGKVYAFEPDPDNFRLLCENLALSGVQQNFRMYNIALADQISASALYLSNDNLGDHRLFDDGTSRECISVNVSTLDSFFADDLQKPTIVKSDTQGSEGRILLGAQRLFESGWRPIIILEFWPYGLSNTGFDPLSLYLQLTAMGYNPRWPSDNASPMAGAKCLT